MACKTRFATVTALAALALIPTVLGGCTKAVTTPAAPAVKTVTATGSGTVSAAPDQAEMSFGVSRRSRNANAALKATSKSARRITTALRKGGVKKKDIQTQDVSVWPQTTYRNGKEIVTGFQASVRVRAKIRDISKLGPLIDKANKAGAGEVDGPTMTISENAPYRNQAAEKAVANARKSAESMAKAAGKRVGAVLSITDGIISAPPGPFYGGAGLSDGGYSGQRRVAYADKSTPIEPGQLEVTSDVTVIFELM